MAISNNIPAELLASKEAPETGGSIKLDVQPKPVTVTSAKAEELPEVEPFIPEPAKTFTATSRINIDSPAQTGVRPRINGNDHDASGSRIRRPSSSLSTKLAESGEKMRREASALKAKSERVAKEQSPESLLARVAYLERQLKKMVTEVNRLKKSGDKS